MNSLKGSVYQPHCRAYQLASLAQLFSLVQNGPFPAAGPTTKWEQLHESNKIQQRGKQNMHIHHNKQLADFFFLIWSKYVSDIL